MFPTSKMIDTTSRCLRWDLWKWILSKIVWTTATDAMTMSISPQVTPEKGFTAWKRVLAGLAFLVMIFPSLGLGDKLFSKGCFRDFSLTWPMQSSPQPYSLSTGCQYYSYQYPPPHTGYGPLLQPIYNIGLCMAWFKLEGGFWVSHLIRNILF